MGRGFVFVLLLAGIAFIGVSEKEINGKKEERKREKQEEIRNSKQGKRKRRGQDMKRVKRIQYKEDRHKTPPRITIFELS